MSVDVLAASELDLEAYAALQHRVFAEVLAQTGTDPGFLTAAHFAWKYSPPAGQARVAVVRDDAGQMVAVNAMFPMEVVGPQGESLIAWQSCDTATAPEGRGRGNFMRCLGALVDNLDDGAFFLGFPNANSIRGFVKLGWAERGVVTTWARPVLPLGLSPRPPAPARLDLLGAEAFDRVRIAPPGAWEVRRSTAWLRWRYPSERYIVHAEVTGGQARALGVLRKVRSVGRELAVVLELWGETRAHERRMFRTLVGQARQLGAQGLVLLDSERSLTDVPGLLPVPARYLPKRQVLMGGVKRGGTMHGPAFPARWRVQTGDWDGF